MFLEGFLDGSPRYESSKAHLDKEWFNTVTGYIFACHDSTWLWRELGLSRE